MPRWLAHLLVVVGWFLTPIAAWAASYVGLWLGALVAVGFESPLVMLAIALAVSGGLGFGTLFAWVRGMRRLPHLLAHHMAARDSAPEEKVVAAAD